MRQSSSPPLEWPPICYVFLLMKSLRFLPLLLVILAGVARANPVSGLTNTGADSSGNVLADGSSDPTWTVTGPGNSTPVAASIGNLAWFGANALSEWIFDPIANGDYADFDYTTTFTIAAGAESTVSISGQYAADDVLENVYLNGTALNISENSDAYVGNFISFDIPAGAYFQAGTNTLTFDALNEGGAGGFRVEMTATGQNVPDGYSTAGLLAMSLGLTALATKRLAPRRVGC
jgi:hypothetical protein